ncbi:MAG TPA: pyrimidine dimer DNA glycosylase/endonuclease V [Pseudomonadales bacterium]
MRLWTLHPKHLDRIGLVALWRETLLAQKVLQGATRGYRQHPQLVRFRRQADPVRVIGCYASLVADEAELRGYRFLRDKLIDVAECERIPCTTGQVEFERRHLLAKLERRDPCGYRRLLALPSPELHPLFVEWPGPVEDWEVSIGR